ncbi:Fur family transcriptional regulator [Nostoc sp. 106C]|jgi:Fur family ferric uptake transcriptional regulator|uniref:Fur family transcriptional regulator n=1 Tax=Nostoc sp. 106C TaxID=1932667 RepID=UPI000A3A2481|nr:Fur family transcriptional regulator [Nostoc sp. 106C]OUL18825.1 transcriptional repressor [Nostoc sp. RF31YmG]OUL32136.1 transcriptional repressor [Nostoc sp. 106C]
MAPQLKSYEDVLEYCRERGMRLTKQRQFILKLLWDTDEHLTASAIYHRLRQQDKKIGYTSIYQNLVILVNAGAIERIEKAEGSLYSHPTLCHSHVHCLDNGQVIDVMVMLPQEIITAVEAQLGLEVSNYRIEFFAHQPQPRI